VSPDLLYPTEFKVNSSGAFAYNHSGVKSFSLKLMQMIASQGRLGVLLESRKRYPRIYDTNLFLAPDKKAHQGH